MARHMAPDHIFGAAVIAVRSPICPPALKKEVAAIQKIESVVDQINGLISQTSEILDGAKDSGDLTLRLKAIETARRNVETLAKLTGQLSNGGTNQINVGISPEEYNKTVSHVIRALEPFPDARIAVLAALEGIKIVEVT